MTIGYIMIIKTALAILTAVFSVIVGILWWRSATVKVTPEEADVERERHFAKHGRTGYVAWTFFDGSDMEFTLKRQNIWNRRAAMAASVAAFCQTLYVATDWIPTTP